MKTILWLITKLRHRKVKVGYLAQAKNCTFGKGCRLLARARVYNSTFGDNTHVFDAIVRNSDIGSGTGIAEGSRVGVYNRRNKRTRIGDNVMIGTGAVIMEGVRIGDNAWVGALTVIRSNVPKNAVVVGNPAKVHRIQTDKKVMG